MKRYRSSLFLSAIALSVFCLILLSLSTEIWAMGQTGFDLATPSQAEPEETEDGERESEDAVIQTGELRIATGSNAELLEVVKVIAVPSDLVIEAEAGRAEEMISQAFQKDPICKSASVRLSDGSRRVFPIEYDYGSLDDTQTGLVMLSGTIVPPDGCHISAELAETELPILLYNPKDPCELPVVSVSPLSGTQILLPENAVLNDLLQGIKSERRVYYILEGGLTWSAEIFWNLDAVNFGTPGTYKITAQPVLPDGIFLPDELPELAFDIIIQEDGAFFLGPPVFTGLYMIVQWTKETPDLEKFRCFYAVGDGPWMEDTEQDLISIPDFAPQSFQVFYYEDVFFNIPYYFQISYDGEYSNILKVYFSKGQIHYRLYDGDRDGGDREDQTPPDISQTVPPGSDSTGDDKSHRGPSGHRELSGTDCTAAASVADPLQVETDSGNAEASADIKTGSVLKSESEAALEEDTTDYTVYSGRRLQKYRELNPGRPLFVTKHRIQVEIPMEDKVFSRLKDSSLLRVEIQSPSEDTIRLELYIDGDSVPSGELPALTVTMPYSAAEKNATLQMVDLDGTVLATAQTVDSTHITFTVNRTGIFRVQETSVAETVPELDSENTLTKTDGTGSFPADSLEKEAPAMPDSAGKIHLPLIPTLLTALFLFTLSALVYIRHFGQTHDKHIKKYGAESAEINAKENDEGSDKESIEENVGENTKSDKKGGEKQ